MQHLDIKSTSIGDIILLDCISEILEMTIINPYTAEAHLHCNIKDFDNCRIEIIGSTSGGSIVKHKQIHYNRHLSIILLDANPDINMFLTSLAKTCRLIGKTWSFELEWPYKNPFAFNPEKDIKDDIEKRKRK